MRLLVAEDDRDVAADDAAEAVAEMSVAGSVSPVEEAALAVEEHLVAGVEAHVVAVLGEFDLDGMHLVEEEDLVVGDLDSAEREVVDGRAGLVEATDCDAVEGLAADRAAVAAAAADVVAGGAGHGSHQRSPSQLCPVVCHCPERGAARASHT